MPYSAGRGPSEVKVAEANPEKDLMPSAFADDPNDKVCGELLSAIADWQKKNSKNPDRMQDDSSFRYGKNEIITLLYNQIHQQVRKSWTERKNEKPVYLRQLILRWGVDFSNVMLPCNYAFVTIQRSLGESTLKQILDKALKELPISSFGFTDDPTGVYAHAILQRMMRKMTIQLMNEEYLWNMVKKDDLTQEVFVYKDNERANIKPSYRCTGKDKINEIKRLVNDILSPSGNSLKEVLNNWNRANSYYSVISNRGHAQKHPSNAPNDTLMFLIYREVRDEPQMDFRFLLTVFNELKCAEVSAPAADAKAASANAAAVPSPLMPPLSAAPDIKAPTPPLAAIPLNPKTIGAFFCKAKNGTGPIIDKEYEGIYPDDVRGVVCRELITRLAGKWVLTSVKIPRDQEVESIRIIQSWSQDILASLEVGKQERDKQRNPKPDASVAQGQRASIALPPLRAVIERWVKNIVDKNYDEEPEFVIRMLEVNKQALKRNILTPVLALLPVTEPRPLGSVYGRGHSE